MPFIIWGTRGITGTVGEGHFFCPQCDDDKTYRMRRVRRFFTLYFIPLIPLGELGRYVECDMCSGTYDSAVLEFDPRRQLRDFKSTVDLAMRRIMVLMMMADGDIDDSEVEAIVMLSEKLPGDPLTEEDVRTEIASAESDGRSAADYAKTVAGVLNDGGKEMVLRAALVVAAADGNFDPEEKALLLEIAAGLEMTPQQIEAVTSA